MHFLINNSNKAVYFLLYARKNYQYNKNHPLLFTGKGIFLSGSAEQEASGGRPMGKAGRKQAYNPA